MSRPILRPGRIVIWVVVVALALAAFIRCEPSFDPGPIAVRRTDLMVAVEVAPADGGTVAVDPPRERFVAGDEVAFVATAAGGYMFERWTGDAEGAADEWTTTITDSITVVAEFVAVGTPQYGIDPVDAGTVVCDPAEGPYREGDVVRLYPVPAAGYVFVGWRGQGGDQPLLPTGTDGSIAVTIGETEPPVVSFAALVLVTTAASPADGGIVAVDPAGPVAPGTAATITGEANQGYVFSHFSIGEEADSITDNPATVTVTQGMTATAVFVPATYDVTTSTEGSGTVLRSNSGDRNAGSIIRFDAVADAGWLFDHWEGDASGTNPSVEVAVSGPIDVTAVFARSAYDINTDVVGKGVVQVSVDGRAPHESFVRFSALPKSGWVFGHWEGDLSGSEPTGDVTVTGPTSVTAVFVRETYDVVTTAEGGGVVQTRLDGAVDQAIPVGGAEFESTVEFVAVPDTGWVFSHWEGDAEGTEDTVEVMVTGPTSATAVFVRETYDVVTTVEGGGVVQTLLDGAVDPAIPVGGAEFESTVEFVAVPDTGWVFSHWEGDAAGTAETVDVTITKPTSVTAVFVRETYDVVTTAEGGGVVQTRLDGAVDQAIPVGGAEFESTVEFVAVPDTGWVFSHWEGDAEGTEDTVEVMVTGPTSATAVFVRETYDVVTTVEGGGVVQTLLDGAVDPAIPVGGAEFESTVEFVAVPDTGWVFSHWEGDAAGTAETVDVTITKPTSVTAVFVHELYEITTAIVGGGTIESTGGELVYGSVIGFEAVPDPGWRFDHWEGDAAGTEPVVETTITGSTFVTAVFVANEVTVLVYLNGDNDLEFNLIEDLNEMEAANLDRTGLRVLALVDRSPFYDTSNGDWSGTRLYEILNDPAGENSLLVSRELESAELGLTVGAVEELNLGSRSTLEAFLSWGKATYPAPVEMLVIWGHGSGYRSGPTASIVGVAKEPGSHGSYRATAIDDSSGSDALYTAELGAALQAAAAAGPIDIVGFDTCFGAQFEVYYELAGAADYAVASQDVTPADGWDYRALFNRLAAAESPSSAEVAVAVVEEYQSTYQTIPDASISAFRLSHVLSVSGALNALSDALTSAVYSAADSAAVRDGLRDGIFSNVEDFYATPGDLSIDLGDLGHVIESDFDHADTEARALSDAVDAAVLAEWHGTGNPDSTGVSVHFVPLTSSGVPEVHHDSYFQGRSTQHPLAFVEDSSWVPGDSGGGLLYHLWYEELE